MMDMEVNPKLRVAPLLVEVQGKKALLFQDPDRVTDESVIVPYEAAVIIQYFDGTMSPRQIQEELMRQTGQLVDSEMIKDLAEQLDERLLLDSPRFHAHIQKLSEEWRALPARPPSHAGTAYPEDPAELKLFLDDFYRHPKGPGPLPAAAEADDLKAAVAPHMDLTESGHLIAHAFKTIALRSRAELFVIFGTGHLEPQRIFTPTDKDYQTPLGVCPTDRDLLDRIQLRLHDRNPIDDYIHKQEHSIEFMVLFLQHALAGRRDFKVLPILVSGFSPSVLASLQPSRDPAYRDFMTALKAELGRRSEPVCFIAGADLAHLGPRYGDQDAWAPIRMAEEKEIDRKMLAPLASGDKEGFFTEIARGQDARRICGLPPIYATVDACGASRAETLGWDYWHDEESHSVVSFVSMALY